VKKATPIVEQEFKKYKPGQYFAVIIDNKESAQQSRALRIQEGAARLLNVPSRNITVRIFSDKATGVDSGKRRYGEIVGVKAQTMDGKLHQTAVQNLVSLQAKIINENPSVSRVFYAVRDLTEKKPYIIGIRSVETKDFLTAKVSEIPWSTLERVSEEIIEMCPNVSTVYYDVTPKPPATIEME